VNCTLTTFGNVGSAVNYGKSDPRNVGSCVDLSPFKSGLFFTLDFTRVHKAQGHKIQNGQKSHWTSGIMTNKKRVNLLLDNNLIEELKSKGYNVSYLCNKAMETYCSEEFGDIELAAKVGAIDTVIDDLKVTMTQKQLEYDTAKRNLESMVVKRAQVIEDFENAQNTLRLSRLMQDLNRNIIASEFDVVTIQLCSQPLLALIRELSPHFNLEVHVQRFKSVITS